MTHDRICFCKSIRPLKASTCESMNIFQLSHRNLYHPTSPWWMINLLRKWGQKFGITVVYRLSVYRFSTLYPFKALDPDRRRWSHYIIKINRFSGLCWFRVPFGSDRQSALSRYITVFCQRTSLPLERCVFGQFGSALKSTKSKRKLLGHGIFCSRALKPT